MIRMEIRPGQGGEDATMFAEQLVSAIAKNAGVTYRQDNGMFTIDCLWPHIQNFRRDTPCTKSPLNWKERSPSLIRNYSSNVRL